MRSKLKNHRPVTRYQGQSSKPAPTRAPKPAKELPPRSALLAALADVEAQVEHARTQAAATLARQEARVPTPRPRRESNGDARMASPSGHCHICDRPITGERRYCGSCLVNRGRM